MEPKQKQHSVVDGTGDRSKDRCCKEHYCIGTWNIRSMNQGKLKVVKQEMARENIDILGISELKWTGKVNLTQMTIISITLGRNPSEEMDRFLEKFNLPRLRQEEIEILNNPITSTEIEAVNKHLPKNKTSRPDGEFCQTFREELMPVKTLSKNCRGRNTSKLILRGHHQPDTKTRQRRHKIRKYP